MEGRQELLASWVGLTAVDGSVAAPGNAATITIFDSGSREGTQQLAGQRFNKGVRWKRIITSSVASADSGASGVSFQASFDNGTNWDVIVTYTDTAAGAPNIHYVSVAFPRWRMRYTNSAAVLTSWRGSIVGDEYERASQ